MGDAVTALEAALRALRDVLRYTAPELREERLTDIMRRLDASSPLVDLSSMGYMVQVQAAETGGLWQAVAVCTHFRPTRYTTFTERGITESEALRNLCAAVERHERKDD